MAEREGEREGERKTVERKRVRKESQLMSKKFICKSVSIPGTWVISAPSLFMAIARAMPFSPIYYTLYHTPYTLHHPSSSSAGPTEKAANKARAQHACNYLKGKTVEFGEEGEQQIAALLTSYPHLQPET